MLRPRHFLHPAMSLQNTINIAYCGSFPDFCIQCLAVFFNCCDMAFFCFSLAFLKNIFFLLVAELSVMASVFIPCKLFETLSLKAFDYFLKYTSSSYQELICKGWFLPPNTYDCGSFVVNGTAVVGKEPKKPYNRWKSTQKGADSYEISI